MRKIDIALGTCLCLLVLLTTVPLTAAPLADPLTGPASPDALAGYTETRPGVWEATRADGSVHRLASGPEGLTWALAELHRASQDLLGRYLAEPSDELWSQIQGLSATLDELRRDIEAQRSTDPEGQIRTYLEAAKACAYFYETYANAYSLSPGAAATATADWWNACGYLGVVYTAVTADVNGIIDSGTCYRTGTSTSCSSSASVSGSGTCSSSAFAYVYVSALGIVDTSSDSNNSCGTTPLSITLSCVETGYPQHGCTGTASGGTPPYRAYWKEDSFTEFEDWNSPGNGPWSRTVNCRYNHGDSKTMRLRITDSAGAQQIRTWYCGALVP